MKISLPIISAAALTVAWVASCASESSPAAAPASAAPASAPAASSTTASTSTAPKVRKFVKDYTVEELFRPANISLRGGRNYDRGQRIFTEIGCNICHHFGGGTGGIGPDLTGVGGRFGADGILDSIINPSNNISDLYGKIDIYTTDNKVYSGRKVGESDETIDIVPNWGVDSTGTASWNGPVTKVKLSEVAAIEDSPVSPMPPAMINNLEEDEIFDLLAYLISGGNPDNRMFKPLAAPTPAPGSSEKK